MACTFVIFGASGDLTSRKLIPAIFRLYCQQRLPAGTHVVGCARTEFSHESWRNELRETTQKFLGDSFDANQWDHFAPLISYQPLDIGTVEDFQKLDEHLHQVEPPEGAVTRIYYLATSPNLYASAVANLGAAGMAAEEKGPRRIVIEKPFGTDLRTAKELNHAVHQVFREGQVYRIDHYLGKETVQNLLVLRFANSIFEPIWNRNYIDHVQITVAEEVLVGRRGGYYDQAGVLRDMFQNHLLQLMTITAMEAPVKYSADLVRDEKVKILQAVRPLRGGDFASDTYRAQYENYRKEPGVPAESETATFAVVKLWLDTWRWHGVPFYLRSGKGLSCQSTQIVVQFREPPLRLFGIDERRHLVPGNRLIVQIQPAEGIQLQMQTKVPDAGMKMQLTDLDFRFNRAYSGNLPDAYQRLLLDATAGDASLFARSDEVELAWSIIDPILEAWKSPAAPQLEFYTAGDWGPTSASQWMRDQGREWFDVCPVLH
ncbi:MAG: glucose-6-phosphate dehydrogenase [Planctomycetales bacterium]|nr:glucose-6-phosphate dehydrogenase [Planctomycetales bacterium]